MAENPGQLWKMIKTSFGGSWDKNIHMQVDFLIESGAYGYRWSLDKARGGSRAHGYRRYNKITWGNWLSRLVLMEIGLDYYMVFYRCSD